MYIILWLVFGAIVGWIASIIMKRDANMGLVANIIVGLIGSALGMWLMEIFGLGRQNAFSIEGLIVSVGGAVILIVIISGIKRK